MDAASVTIVVVDDEPALLKMTATFLERRGYNAMTFSSTDKAMEYIESAPAAVRVALLDLTMPGLNPLEVARRLLAMNPEAKVIVASGYPVELTELEESAPHRVAFLHKPFAPEMLTELIRTLLA